jgi:hypothetical protein
MKLYVKSVDFNFVEVAKRLNGDLGTTKRTKTSSLGTKMEGSIAFKFGSTASSSDYFWS